MTTSPSWIFESLVPILIVVAAVLVFVYGPWTMVFVLGEQTSWVKTRSLITITKILEIKDGKSKKSIGLWAAFLLFEKPIRVTSCNLHVVRKGYWKKTRSLKVLTWKIRNEIGENEVGKFSIKLERFQWSIYVRKLILKLERSFNVEKFSNILTLQLQPQLSKYNETFQLETFQINTFELLFFSRLPFPTRCNQLEWATKLKVVADEVNKTVWSETFWQEESIKNVTS